MQGITFNQQGIKGIESGTKCMTRRPIKQNKIESFIEQNSYTFNFSHFIEELNKSLNGWYISHSFKNVVNEFLKYKIGEKVELLEVVFINGEEDLLIHGEAVVKSIRVERLQDISEEDCVKEGLAVYMGADKSDCLSYLGQGDTMTHQECYEEYVWNNLPYKAPYDWKSNPYCFIYEFERVQNEI